MYRNILPGLLWVLQPLKIFGQTVIPLDGTSWTLENASKNISIPGRVPGSVHLDLLAAKVIGDPYYGLNEVNLRWVIGDVWKYSRPISIDLSPNMSTYLEFDGLDTFASIKLCGTTIGITNNQFRQYTFEVSSSVQRCSDSSNIEIEFAPATSAANNAAQNASCPLCFGINYEFDNMQFIRKQQCDFGWDWGPAFSPTGIWKSIRIVQVPTGFVQIQNSMVDIYRQGQVNNLPPDQAKPWVMNVSVDFLGHISGNPSMIVKLSNRNNETVLEKIVRNIMRIDNGFSSRTTADFLTTEDVELWWPVGYGNQTLYNLSVQIQDERNHTLATVERRVGFRTVVLDQREIPNDEISKGVAPGNKWSFQINGLDIYCKGSNFIPPDSFWTRVMEDRVKDMLDSVIDSNQNMIRVWGGGSYLPDFIYDMADEMGLIIWTDFQFSDALSPIDPAFLENVRAEADYQVRRVNHHPSMAAWVGNNEVELGLQLAEQVVPAEAVPLVIKQYETLFVDILLRAVFDNTRSLSYSPSSITNGYLSFNFSSPTPIIERYFNVTPGTISGNTDYYNYDTAKAFNNSAYPLGRFATEFGFHSMPSLQTWRQVTPEPDLHFNSSVILTHNHHYATSLLTADYSNQTAAALGGMGQMTIAAEQYYPIPPNDPHSIANFSSWIYTTQVFQADFMRNQISFYRIGSGRLERNLGALYWQLNDIWQAPTWAGLEYDGRWKMLHYIVKNVFKPVIMAPSFNYTTGALEVYAVSDLWSTASGTAKVTWYDWSGNVLNTSSRSVEIGAINTTITFQMNTQNLRFNVSNAVAKFEIEAQSTPPHLTGPATYTQESWFHAVPLKDQAMVDPILKMTYDDSKDKFIVSAENGVAAWVWLDHPSGVVGNFEDNGFWLVPGEVKEVGFKVKRDDTAGEWAKSVTVRSLWDNKL
ncbi:putative beta-mannosidase [Rhexocercosporidium sp. MPI-PUGE-AT-0058]|nr:putative beta-mannosidase [Rhexocercosporidium sp. MPI-PUGE-AT-0058]